MSQEVEVSPMSLDPITGNTLNITSAKRHILETFSDDNTYGESIEQSLQRPVVGVMTPRAQHLLAEIEDIEHSLLEVRKTASKEKVNEIEQRQDPFLQQMATIKQHMVDQ